MRSMAARDRKLANRNPPAPRRVHPIIARALELACRSFPDAVHSAISPGTSAPAGTNIALNGMGLWLAADESVGRVLG